MLIKNKWKYHLLLWLAVILLGWITDYGTRGWEGLAYSLSWEGLRYDGVFYISSIIIYFLNYQFICPRYLSKGKISFFLLSILGLLIAFALVRYFLDEVLFKFLVGTNNYNDEARTLPYYFFNNIQYALRGILYSSVIFLIFRFMEVQNQIMQVQLNHKKAELSFLKSQISPHFLFNTLNTFYSELIETQPNTANDIHRLSELLRFVTYEAGEEWVDLKKEMAFIKDYIYFYEKRYENELALEFNIIGQIQDQRIASLILMHFIENVFKHGVLTEKEHPAMIHISIEEAFLSIRTKNKIEHSTKYMDAGIGLENLQRRLDAIYQNKYELHSTPKEDYFEAYLKIPL